MEKSNNNSNPLSNDKNMPLSEREQQKMAKEKLKEIKHLEALVSQQDSESDKLLAAQKEEQAKLDEIKEARRQNKEDMARNLAQAEQLKKEREEILNIEFESPEDELSNAKKEEKAMQEAEAKAKAEEEAKLKAKAEEEAKARQEEKLIAKAEKKKNSAWTKYKEEREKAKTAKEIEFFKKYKYKEALELEDELIKQNQKEPKGKKNAELIKLAKLIKAQQDKEEKKAHDIALADKLGEEKAMELLREDYELSLNDRLFGHIRNAGKPKKKSSVKELENEQEKLEREIVIARKLAQKEYEADKRNREDYRRAIELLKKEHDAELNKELYRKQKQYRKAAKMKAYLEKNYDSMTPDEIARYTEIIPELNAISELKKQIKADENRAKHATYYRELEKQFKAKELAEQKKANDLIKDNQSKIESEALEAAEAKRLEEEMLRQDYESSLNDQLMLNAYNKALKEDEFRKKHPDNYKEEKVVLSKEQKNIEKRILLARKLAQKEFDIEQRKKEDYRKAIEFLIQDHTNELNKRLYKLNKGSGFEEYEKLKASKKEERLKQLERERKAIEAAEIEAYLKKYNKNVTSEMLARHQADQEADALLELERQIKEAEKRKKHQYYYHELEAKFKASSMAQQRKKTKKEAKLALAQYIRDTKKAIKEQERSEILEEKAVIRNAHAEVLGLKLAKYREEMLEQIRQKQLLESQKIREKHLKIEKRQYEEELKKQLAERLEQERTTFLEAKLEQKARLLKEKQIIALEKQEEIFKARELKEAEIEIERIKQAEFAEEESLKEKARMEVLLLAIKRQKEVDARLKQEALIEREELKKQKLIDREKALEEAEHQRTLKEQQRIKELEIKREAKVLAKMRKELQARENAIKRRAEAERLAREKALKTKLRQEELKERAAAEKAKKAIELRLKKIAEAKAERERIIKERKEAALRRTRELARRREEARRLKEKEIQKVTHQKEVQASHEINDLIKKQKRIDAETLKRTNLEIKNLFLRQKLIEERAELTKKIIDQKRREELKALEKKRKEETRAQQLLIDKQNKERWANEKKEEAKQKALERKEIEQIEAKKKKQAKDEKLKLAQARAREVEEHKKLIAKEKARKKKEMLDLNRELALKKAKEAKLEKEKKERAKKSAFEEKQRIKKEKALNPNYGMQTVYHIIPRNNGKVWWFIQMGETKPLKTFRTSETAISYVDKLLNRRNDIKVYVNDLKNHVRLYKKKTKK